MIRRWKPWEQSTGPKSIDGKALVSRNGWKGGTRQMIRAISKALNENRQSLEQTHQQLQLTGAGDA